jgi:hypothetical protein
MDGIQLKAKARVTVRTNIETLVGGATEETIIARVGEGIVTTIGSAESHKKVLENPDMISRVVLQRGLDAGTAFEILSIDIADVDVGENIGAQLQMMQAEADKKIAQARAEERRAMAMRARAGNARPGGRDAREVVEAEAEVPKAMAEAFRSGNLGIMDYYRMKNIMADTDMRDSIIVVVILSLASKAQESRKVADRQREKAQRQPQQLSGKARQKIHGRPVEPQTATPREGASPPPVPPQRPVRKPRPVEQELLETLFGVKLNREEETTARQAERQPAVGRDTQQMVERLRGQQADPQRTQARRAAPRPPADADEGPTFTAADMQVVRQDFEKRIRGIRERMHQGMRQGLAQTPDRTTRQTQAQRQTAQQRRQARPESRPAPPPRPSMLGLFQTREDLRNAIIVSEVLGRPKALRNDEAAA